MLNNKLFKSDMCCRYYPYEHISVSPFSPLNEWKINSEKATVSLLCHHSDWSRMDTWSNPGQRPFPRFLVENTLSSLFGGELHNWPHICRWHSLHCVENSRKMSNEELWWHQAPNSHYLGDQGSVVLIVQWASPIFSHWIPLSLR